jgi:TPR repeat protein
MIPPVIYAFYVLLSFAPILQAGPSTGPEALRSQAEAGNPSSQFELGNAYETGTGVQQNDELAVKWYRAAAEQDFPPAENRLGVMYSRGIGVNRDKEEALRWYKKAAKHRLPEGCFNVAISYYNGDGVSENPELAYAWMLIAKDAGDSGAEDALKRMAGELHGLVYLSEYKLAALYERGDEIPQDLSRAANLYLEIANKDIPENIIAGDAQYKMCQLYATGKGVPLDYVQARSWCKKATKHGIGFAYVVLGRMAERGLGQEKNLKEAADWYEDAALLQMPDGFLSSGKLRQQSPSHDDQKKAYFWFYLAQHYKIKEADSLIQQVSRNLTQKEIADEQKLAMQWVRMPLPEKVRQLKTH